MKRVNAGDERHMWFREGDKTVTLKEVYYYSTSCPSDKRCVNMKKLEFQEVVAAGKGPSVS
jgi:hypothetical protein